MFRHVQYIPTRNDFTNLHIFFVYRFADGERTNGIDVHDGLESICGERTGGAEEVSSRS